MSFFMEVCSCQIVLTGTNTICTYQCSFITSARFQTKLHALPRTAKKKCRSKFWLHFCGFENHHFYERFPWSFLPHDHDHYSQLEKFASFNFLKHGGFSAPISYSPPISLSPMFLCMSFVEYNKAQHKICSKT